jgi:hypothetical protein
MLRVLSLETPTQGHPKTCPAFKHYRYPPLQIAEYTHSNTFTGVMDVLSTMLELAWIKPPQKTFRGRDLCSYTAPVGPLTCVM